MNIPALSVRRPVTTLMLFTGIILLGLISWSKLPQELFPSINYPQITVVTSYENAAPEEIESLVTKIIEEAVGTVSNVKRIKSISREGTSLVLIDFAWGTNMDFAALNVREKVDLIKEKLPRESQDPIIMKYNPFELPAMNLVITAENMSSVKLRELTRRYIKEDIEKIDGVANVAIAGGDIKEIVVGIDQARLHASQLSIISIVDSLKNANLNYPAGTIKENTYEYLIRTMGEFQTIKEIKEIPIALELPQKKQKTNKPNENTKKERRLIYLKDIATVKEFVKEKASISRYNGKDSISLIIRKQSGANTLSVAQKVKKEIKRLLQQRLPAGIDIKITYDQSTFIKEALSNLRSSAVEGGILALFILLFFLRDIRSSLTIALSIPVSLMATFCIMYFAKINLNMMSLGGLALGIGMLVDNSIVVIENIFRHRQMNKSLKESCGEGANEVFMPILGSTLTTVAVFLPFVFVTGIAGQIFKQLSLTITFSLIVSIFVSISLIPVIISLGNKNEHRRFSASESNLPEKFSLFLSSMFKIKGLIILTVIVAFFIGLKLLTLHERKFLPEVDQRQFIIKVELLPGTRLKVTDSKVREIERILSKIDDVKDVTVNIGSNDEKSNEEKTMLRTMGSHQARIMINLKKRSREYKTVRSTKEIIASLEETIKESPQLNRIRIDYVTQTTSLGQRLEESMPVAIEIRGPELNQLAELSTQIKKEIKKIRGLYSIRTSLITPTPETKLHILKDKASLYGLSTKDIALAAQVALKGYVATKFKTRSESKDIDIRVRLRAQDRAKLKDLRRFLIRSPLKVMVPLSEVAYLVKGTGPTEIQRIDQQRAVLVTSNISNRPLREITKRINKAVTKISRRFPDIKDYSIKIAGEQQKMQESFKSLAFTLYLAIILVYMIMASEFESLWQPFIIMFIVPFSLIGIAFILLLTKTPLSVVAYLGIIMLGGIVVNNGIVLIDFINKLRSQGYSAKEAAIRGTSIRLRPILMTSLTTILGMLPLSLGVGEGSELRTPLAKTVIGGLLSSTFLTLIVIPIIYVEIAKFIETLKKQFILFKENLVTSKSQKFVPIQEVAVPFGDKSLEKSQKESEQDQTLPQENEQPIPQENKDLHPRQTELLEKLKELRKITRVEYAKMFNVSIPTAARDLKKLVKRKLIVGKGPLGPGRWYELR